MGSKDTVRALADVITLPAPSPGFIGEGHTAIHVMEGREFARTDPFIMLADDRVNLPPGTGRSRFWADVADSEPSRFSRSLRGTSSRRRSSRIACTMQIEQVPGDRPSGRDIGCGIDNVLNRDEEPV